jgi:hypothetical protein
MNYNQNKKLNKNYNKSNISIKSGYNNYKKKVNNLTDDEFIDEHINVDE